MEPIRLEYRLNRQEAVEVHSYLRRRVWCKQRREYIVTSAVLIALTLIIIVGVVWMRQGFYESFVENLGAIRPEAARILPMSLLAITVAVGGYLVEKLLGRRHWIQQVQAGLPTRLTLTEGALIVHGNPIEATWPWRGVTEMAVLTHTYVVWVDGALAVIPRRALPSAAAREWLEHLLQTVVPSGLAAFPVVVANGDADA